MKRFLNFKVRFAFFMFFLITLTCFKVSGQKYFKKPENRDSLQSDSTLQLYINPDLLNEKEKAIFINALSAFAIKKEVYDTIKIGRFQSVNLLLKKLYNYTDNISYKTNIILKQKVKDINSLNEKYLIFAGDSLSFPTIPKNPKKGNLNSFTQVFDFVNYKSFVSPTKSLIDYKINKISKNIKQEEAGLWMYNLSKKDLEIILDSIPIELQSKLYGQAFITSNEYPRFVELAFQDTSDFKEIGISNPLFPIATSSSLKHKLSTLKSDDFKNYYVIDYFNGDECSHGKHVLSVIKQRLKEYGLDSLKINIIPVQMDYFKNPSSAINFLERCLEDNSHIKELTKIEIRGAIKSLNRLTKKQIKDEQNKCPKCVPEVFADACLKYYYADNPDIISTSLWIMAQRGVKANFVGSSNTNFVTAALNNAGSKDEDLIENKYGSIEPLVYCYTTYPLFGSIIVGSQIGQGKFSGMRSITGKGISTLGIGIGYDSIQNCFGPSSYGTSYATPDVAIKLLIAKAYWRAKNMTPFPSAIETRTRLLLCSDIDTAFIGKFASAGLPNLDKLLMISNGFTEDNFGILHECTISDKSFIAYNENSQRPFKRGNDGISGLTFLDNKVLAFFESELSWKPIEPKKISLTIISNGTIDTLTTIEQIKTKYKQLIKLKN